jgi:hypothetical protein
MDAGVEVACDDENICYDDNGGSILAGVPASAIRGN